MRTYKVTITYEVKIDADPSDRLTMLHIIDSVYASQEHGTPHQGTTDVKPSMSYLVTETDMAFEELDC